MSQKPTLNKYLILFVVILVALSTWKITDYFADKKLEKEQIENRKLKISKDKLEKVSDGYYRKLVADTLTKKELKKEIEDLQIKVKDGVIVEKIKFVPVEVEKPVDSVSITKDSVTISDFYPSKEDWFINYQVIVNINDSTSLGNFSFNEIGIDLVISQNDDGTFQSDLKAPEFIKVNSLDILALPLTPKKTDNFGFLAGGKINRNFDSGNFRYEVMGGIRIKKTNLIISTDVKEFGAGLLFEF